MLLKVFMLFVFSLNFVSFLKADNIMVTQEEQDKWFRYLIPLPKEISIKEKITINPEDISIIVKPNSSEIEQYAVFELRELFKKN